MSMNVELGELADRLGEYGFAYLVSVGDAGTAHVLAVLPELTADGLLVEDIGRHTHANATLHPVVTLVWPPPVEGGYSLIVDGTAVMSLTSLTVAPTKAILHRPAPGQDGKRLGNDCRPVTLA